MKLYRTNQTFKVLAVYLALNIILPQSFVYNAYSLTGGPSQPEFNTFTPIGTSDMVNLSSGDFNYNIPVMDVGGYPLNLSYDSGVTMDEEASWVGLGWNLNVGQINRNVRGLPDDFDGDQLIYENNFKDNRTVGAHFGVGVSFAGLKELAGLNIGLGVQWNNYNGLTFNPSFGISFELSKSVSLGLNVSGSVADGATVTPTISYSSMIKGKGLDQTTSSLGISMNSRQALTSVNLSQSMSRSKGLKKALKAAGKKFTASSPSIGGSFSFNDNLLFTPTKRVATISDNKTFSAAVGGTAFTISGQAKVTGYGSSQKIHPSEHDKKVRAFGYENTERNEILGGRGVLDFNREKDRGFNKNTTLLSLTNYTYDMYSVNGQGISGGFRPYRSQVGYVYDPFVADTGSGKSFGGEGEVGWIFAFGFDFKSTYSFSSSGLWAQNNYALRKFTKATNNPMDYEKVYFRNTGELNVDNENNQEGLFSKKLLGDSPINLAIVGGRYGRASIGKYYGKGGASIDIKGKLKREKRLLRNQVVQKIKVGEARKFNSKFFSLNPNSKQNHTAGFHILKTDGSSYIYGKTAYNTLKKEATFAVDGSGNCATGIIKYASNDNSKKNTRGEDHFFNRITTPPYAHTYLLTSVLSSDYEDKTNDGPTDDDFGSYTKFNYKNPYTYKWRVPYGEREATFNEGFYSHPDDQKANYVYGEREQIYINSIETKTHIAFFHLSDRKDGYGVIGEDGGQSLTVTTKKIDSISLYSKKEYLEDKKKAKPIKTAHFVYDYSLCKGVPNNNSSKSLTKNELSNDGGKLTLKRVYFTYQDSKMGSYMPYEFNYGEIDTNNDGVFDEVSNPDYHVKGYDIWGNYKENSGNCGLNGDPTTAEFPYVNQDSQVNANKNVVAWTLTSLKLPSGGDMKIHYESDDYQYVQNREVMQLFQVSGVGTKSIPAAVNNPILYALHDNKYLYVKIPKKNGNGTYSVDDFIKGIREKPIYFKFLLNMTGNEDQFDFVSGYFMIDNNPVEKFTLGNDDYLSIPMKFMSLDGGTLDKLRDILGARGVNPISKAGMYFGRQNMNRIVYSIGGDSANKDFTSAVYDLIGSIGTLFEIGKGPNRTLRDKGCAMIFKPKKSWVRLLNPSNRKLGGGVRVRRLQMEDNWDVMTDNNDNTLYEKFYGQVYSYKNSDGSTSGVATFEPNGSRENPFVEPLSTDEDKILAPKKENFVERPIGESFFPAPIVTYGRVTVENIPYKDITKHATGKVVNEFYTSYDFPTKTAYSPLDRKSMFYDKANGLSQFFNFNVKNHLTASQGFTIERNDMNGKQKAQWVYAQNQDDPLSGVEYKYSLKSKGQLNNLFRVVDENGDISQKIIGVENDVVNDFRENLSISSTMGINTNVSGFLAFIFPVVVPLPLPTFEYHENLMRTAVTTKVIKRQGLLEKKIAYDLGAKVSTDNIAWDANTGQVLVTKTVNEYDDAYYNINYPAYWKYKGMGSASKNLDITGSLDKSNDEKLFFSLRGSAKASDYFKPGDELNATYMEGDNSSQSRVNKRLWVVNVSEDNVILMDRKGKLINDCEEYLRVDEIDFKIIRSSYRNMQNASMASITTKVNPIYEEDSSVRKSIPSFYEMTPKESKIINASAVEYSDFWKPVNEEANKYFIATKDIYEPYDSKKGVSPYVSETDFINGENFLKVTDDYDINPYIYNIRGEWKAKRSWAFLTGRQQSANLSTKNDGYFTSFTPFYKYNTKDKYWEINKKALPHNKKSRSKWTFASEVTKYSPYGVELENKDALDRYSSAQYGYKYTLPTAVASNTKYTEIGYDGFEDYEKFRLDSINSHFSFADAFGANIYSITTDEEAHTGRKSIGLDANRKVRLFKNLVDRNPALIQDCEVPEDGGNDNENAFFSVKDVSYTKGECLATLKFTILGIPNSEIKYFVNGTPYTIWTNSRGKKQVSHQRIPNNVGVCRIGNDPYLKGGAPFRVKNVKGDTMIFTDEETQCSDCFLYAENIVEEKNECTFKVSFTLVGYKNKEVTYFVNGDDYKVRLDSNGKKRVSHSVNLNDNICDADDSTAATEVGQASVVVKDEENRILLDRENTFTCGDCRGEDYRDFTISNEKAEKDGCSLKVSYTIEGRPNEKVQFLLNGENETVRLDESGKKDMVTRIPSNITFRDCIFVRRTKTARLVIQKPSGITVLNKSESFNCDDCGF